MYSNRTIDVDFSLYIYCRAGTNRSGGGPELTKAGGGDNTKALSFDF